MVKKTIMGLLLTLLVGGGALMAQVGVKIPANTSLGEQAQRAIATKLQQLATLNGVGSDDSLACFVLVPQVDVVQSEVAPTAPPRQLVKLSVVLMVMETTNAKSIVAQTEVASKGVGSSGDAAVLNAIQQINVRSAVLKRFMEQAKKSIKDAPPCKKEVEVKAEVEAKVEEAATEQGNDVEVDNPNS